ncbi:phytoene/squalene synthase family protein [Lysobacter humi (ex Lee et al. 2017)]
MNTETGADDAGTFVDKWRTACPEWAIAEVFVPASQRAVATAWSVLQVELLDAAWGGADARPGEAKLGWWMEELDGWAQGRRRHPLGAVLQRCDGGWSSLARSLPQLAATRDRPAAIAEAHEALALTAAAAATTDAGLFGGRADPALVAATWLHARLARHPDGALPLEMLAAGPEGATHWRAHLLAAWPRGAGAPRVRRLQAGLARERLRRGDAARPLPAWAALLASWRAARD